MSNKQFEFRKAQIERYVKAEYEKKFRKNARISVRKRQKFMGDMARKVSKNLERMFYALLILQKEVFFL